MNIREILVILLVYVNGSVVGILDVTLIIPSPIVSHQEETVLQCVSDNSNFTPTKFPFSIKTEVGTGTKMTYDRIYGKIAPEPWPGKQVSFLEKSGPFKYGIFECTVGLGSDKTSAVGIIMSKNARLFPSQLNYRSSSNESVEMSVIQLRQAPYADVSWYNLNNASSVPSRMGSATLSLDVVAEPEISGTYLVFHQTNNKMRRVFQQAITRLIVRKCVWGKYGEDCTGQCPLCENGGICHDVEGTCICPPGFKGPSCETICGANKFGADCQHTCSENENLGCKGKLFCLPDPYGCSCSTGYFGIICSYKCGPGKYGPNCNQECHCVDNECDGFDGTCTNGCKKGWTGSNCQQSCRDFTYGANCVHTCGSCMYGSCDHVSGHCLNYNETANSTESEDPIVCKLGFSPPFCQEPCDIGTWGSDCKLQCNCYDKVTCDIESGQCEEKENGENCAAGWRGVSCNVTCPEGFYGEACSMECGNCLNATICEPISGNCIENNGTCESGYMPIMCDTPCESGFFGINCSTECNCANGTTCNRILGSCEGYCQPGFTGEDCWHPCPHGMYGLNCLSECGNCKMIESGPSCEPAFGTCTYGCKKSWSGDSCLTGILCHQNPCLNDGECSQTEDIYSCNCLPGFSGAHCEIVDPPCDSSPCINNSTCIEHETTYTCSCATNFTGQNCEAEIEDEIQLTTTVHPTTTQLVTTTTKPNQIVQSEAAWMFIILLVIGATLLILGIALLLFALNRKKRTHRINQEENDNIPPQSTIASPSIYSRNSRNLIPTPKPIKEDLLNNDAGSFHKEVNPDNKEAEKPTIPKVNASLPPSPNSERISFEKSNTKKEPVAHVSPLTPQPHDGSAAPLHTPNVTLDETLLKKPKKDEVNRPISAKRVLFSAPEPPSGPTDGVQNPKDPKNPPIRMSKPKIRFNANALERLSEISLHNFYDKRKSSVRPLEQDIEEESPSKDPRKSVASVGGCALTSWDLKTRHPDICGISRRDSMLLVTKPRDASEDFEMESRRGSRTVGRESLYNTAA